MIFGIFKQKLWVSVLLSCHLLLNLAAPLLAQSNPLTQKTEQHLYLPVVRNSNAASKTEDIDDEVTAEDDEEPAVVESDFDLDLLDPAAASSVERIASPALAELRLAGRDKTTASLAQRKIDTHVAINPGRQVVVVRLSEPTVASLFSSAVTASAADQELAQQARVAREQSAVLQQITHLDSQAKVLGQLQKALNALIVETEGTILPTLAADPSVVAIDPVVDYTLALAEPVAYIGAHQVQSQRGFDGTGVTVAVIDSGIDYTHAQLGGPGTVESYRLAYGAQTTDNQNRQRDNLFPTAKVVDGIDFVGELWPNAGPLQPDNDPIDAQGHGTHVADIIGGTGGVAPGAALVAVKACSSTTLTCSGVALLQALDYVLDPNNDGSLRDRVDIVNLSIEQSNYGLPIDNSLAAAVEAVNAAGVLVVAPAGNAGDKPYVMSSPGAIPAVLTVAETQSPAASQLVMAIVAPAQNAGLYPTLFQAWSAPLASPVSGPVQYGDGAGGNGNGCLPFAPGTLTGKVILVDSGVCSASVKISNLADGGALLGVIARTVPGDPVALEPDGGNPTIPAFNIRQVEGQLIKQTLAAGTPVEVKFALDQVVSLAGVVAATSARGPAMTFNSIKPEIAAPGGTISAVAGSGSGVASFHGTASAVPVVAGAAALLRQLHPDRSPAELKALLMNTAETLIYGQLPRFGGDVAPITRIGSGEVRVDQAANVLAAAWADDAPTAALAFGLPEITREKKVLKRVVKIRNYSDYNIRYAIDHSFRFANDAATGAIEIETPDDILVHAHTDREFEVTMIIRGDKLPDWRLNSGSHGADAELLTLLEFDGYLTLTEVDHPDNQLHLPWHVLPRKGADVSLKKNDRYLRVRNRGLGIATVESYSLIATSPNQAEGGLGENRPTPDLRYVGYNTFFAPKQFQICGEQDSFMLAFAFTTWEPQTHANSPASFEVRLDIDRNGVADYAIYTFDRSLNDNLSDGRNMTWVENLATHQAVAAFYTVHETNSTNTVMYACAEDIGLTLANRGQPLDIEVKVLDLLADRYSDTISGITIAPYGERFHGLFRLGGVGISVLLPHKNDRLQVVSTGAKLNNSESGLLLLFRGTFTPDKEAGVVRMKKK